MCYQLTERSKESVEATGTPPWNMRQGVEGLGREEGVVE